MSASDASALAGVGFVVGYYFGRIVERYGDLTLREAWAALRRDWRLGR